MLQDRVAPTLNRGKTPRVPSVLTLLFLIFLLQSCAPSTKVKLYSEDSNGTAQSANSTATNSSTSTNTAPDMQAEEKNESLLPQKQLRLIRRTRIGGGNEKDTSDLVKADCKRQIANQLVKSYRLPKDIEPPLVAVRVSREGTIQSVKIKESSGNDKVDADIIEFISKMQLPSFPPELIEDHFTVKIDFARIIERQSKRDKRSHKKRTVVDPLED